MNRLTLLALVGFVLAIGLALPYTDDKDPVTDDEMEESSTDFKAKEAETLSDLDWDDEKYFPDGNEDEDNEEDGDDDNHDYEEDDDNPLTNPLKKSSDPFFRFRKIFRRRRRSRRGGFRFRRFFGRRRGGR